MNAEYLLDAIGLLDDGLLREAERYRRHKARYGLLLGWAASFAVVLLLSYGATHFGMGGNAPGPSGGGNGMAPGRGGAEAPAGEYSGASAPGAPVDGNPGEAFDPAANGSASPSGEDRPIGTQGAQEALSGAILVSGAQGGGAYILSGEVLTELPEGGRYVCLGRLLALYPDSPGPSTTVEEYVGLNLWTEHGGTDLPSAVYVELPEGGFARAELTEP